METSPGTCIDNHLYTLSESVLGRCLGVAINQFERNQHQLECKFLYEGITVAAALIDFYEGKLRIIPIDVETYEAKKKEILLLVDLAGNRQPTTDN